MRTVIDGGTVVAFDGRGHRLLRGAAVAFEGPTIVYVGDAYRGACDRRIDARGMLVCPGFINTHSHVGIEVKTALLDVHPPGTARWLGPPLSVVSRDLEPCLTEDELRVSGEYALVQLMKSGCTTVLDVIGCGTLWWLGHPPHDVEVLAETAGRLGVRAYLSPGFRSECVYVDPDGEPHLHSTADTRRRGMAALDEAVRFIERYDGRHGGLIRGMLYPHAADNCDPDLLRETKRAAQSLRVGIEIHVAQYLSEVEAIRNRHGKSPVQYLADLEFLGPEVVLGHCLFVSGHSRVGGDPGSDLRLIADAGSSVAHSPKWFAREGLALESFQRYMDAGINMSIGTDFWPLDIIEEMRLASFVCKIVDRDPRVATAADVFTAATLGGARALGRDDLGRLSAGSRADIVLIDIAASERIGPVADPVKGLIAAGTSRDVRTVIIDGRTVVEDSRVAGVDEERLRRDAERVGARLRAALAARDWGGRSEAAIFVPAFAEGDAERARRQTDGSALD